MIRALTTMPVQKAPMVSRVMNKIPVAKYRAEWARKFMYMDWDYVEFSGEIILKNNAYIGLAKLNLDIS
jgi:hypothetical protein